MNSMGYVEAGTGIRGDKELSAGTRWRRRGLGRTSPRYRVDPCAGGVCPHDAADPQPGRAGTQADGRQVEAGVGALATSGCGVAPRACRQDRLRPERRRGHGASRRRIPAGRACSRRRRIRASHLCARRPGGRRSSRSRLPVGPGAPCTDQASLPSSWKAASPSLGLSPSRVTTWPATTASAPSADAARATRPHPGATGRNHRSRPSAEKRARKLPVRGNPGSSERPVRAGRL